MERHSDEPILAAHADAAREWPPDLSPTLRPIADALASVPAFEIKFLIDEATAAGVRRHVAAFLAPDAHADAGGHYAITSLYCDTPAWESFHAQGTHRGRKYRVRRYGQGGPVYLEEKTAQGQEVHKRREPVELAALPHLHEHGPTWAGAWYAREIARRGLRPVCRVAYDRAAFCGQCPEGPMRVTIDRRLRGSLAAEWSMHAQGAERDLLPGHVVCEFKFLEAMPRPLKEAVAVLGLAPRGVSKYRACIRAFGVELGLGRLGDGPDA